MERTALLATIGRGTGTVLIAALMFGTSAAAFADQPFQWYVALSYRDQPDFTRYGAQPLSMAYESSVLGGARNDDGIDAAIAHYTVENSAPALLCLDIERWPLSGNDTEISLRRLSGVAERLKALWPHTQMGFYGLLPGHDYWSPVLNDTRRITAWRLQNARLAPLAASVDAIFPVLYTYYDNPATWAIYARTNLIEARRYGKPVYAFLSPQYHPSSELSGKEIDSAFWREQLALVQRYADGVVIWSAAREPWDEDARWWQDLRNTLAIPGDLSPLR